MKSILLASKPSNNNQLVGSQIRRNESSSIPYHHQHINNNTTTTTTTVPTESAVELNEKEHFNKLFSNSKKQVIRSRCSVKSDVDKLKHVTSDVCDGKNLQSEHIAEPRLTKSQTSDNNSELEFFESQPLIVESKVLGEIKAQSVVKSVKLINLRKKNGTTLIFQKKSNEVQKHQRANEYQELESFKKRRSLQQWPNTSFTNKPDTNNTNRHSWYDKDYYPRAIEEEFDDNDPTLTQFTSKDYNLADINSQKQSFGSSVLDGASSVEHVPEIISMKSSIDGSATSRRWRIEQFLKNLVGKKPLVTQAMAVPKVKRSPSEHDLLQQNFHHQQQLQNDPDPTRSNCGSMMSLNKERLLNKSTASLNSTSYSLVQQKLWSVVPLLSRKDGSSCSNLLSNDHDGRKSNMRKCETVLALTHEPLIRRQHLSAVPSTSSSKSHSKSINNLLEPIKPLNRLRNSQSCYVGHDTDSSGSGRQQTCSRCSSLLSLAAIGSNYSINVTNGAFVLKSCKQHHHSHRHRQDTSPTLGDEIDSNSSHNLIVNDFNEIKPYEKEDNVKAARRQSSIKFTCKLCLGECSTNEKMTKIASCSCSFCTECMKAYVEFEILEGAYELSCPDALCSAQGIVSLAEISQLASPSLVEKHHRYRLNREVELDKNRLWCPNRNCETICSVGPIDKPSSSQSVIQQPSSSNAMLLLPRSVLCPTCSLEFCSSCKKPWHPSMTCEENSRKSGGPHDSMMLFDNDLIKCCPMCAVPIEKDEGCAQMMCKRCKHVFCWYCLASLDDDFLLRHYDKGPCKNKLGHSRASVVWHRAQVIGIFAGFGILLLVASPLLLLAAPCIVCCKCKIEESTTTSKLDIEPLEDVRRTDHQV